MTEADPTGVTADNSLLTALPELGPQVLPGRDTWAAHLHVQCIMSTSYSQFITFFCYRMMMGNRRAASVFDKVAVGLWSGEFRPQASQGNKQQGLRPYMPQIALAINRERDGG